LIYPYIRTPKGIARALYYRDLQEGVHISVLRRTLAKTKNYQLSMDKRVLMSTALLLVKGSKRPLAHLTIKALSKAFGQE